MVIVFFEMVWCSFLLINFILFSKCICLIEVLLFNYKKKLFLKLWFKFGFGIMGIFGKKIGKIGI